MTIRSIVQNLKNRYLSSSTVLIMDIVLSILASILAVLSADIVLGHFQIFPLSEPRMKVHYIAVGAVGSFIAFLILRTYRIVIRRLVVNDLLNFFAAAAIKAAFLMFITYISRRWARSMLMIICLDALITLGLMIFVRLAMILVWEHFNHRIQEKYQYKRVMVYGTSDKSVAAKVRLQNSTHYKVIGFLDQGASGRTIEGLPVFAAEDLETTEKILLGNRIDALLFASDKEAQKEENGLIHFCALKNITCLVVPSVDEVVEGEAILRPREIKIEDLLGREQIQISLNEIADNFKGKTVMVTGAAGSIGSELCRQLASLGAGRLILFDNAETPTHNLRLEMQERFPNLNYEAIIGDVRHPERLDYAFRTFRPQVVFHAAAYKHVPLMEENPCEAVLVNVYGTRNVADKCLEYGTETMVMISTDKAVNPTSVMGCTKRLAEIYVQSLGLTTCHPERSKGSPTRFVTTRFGNVLGSNGSVIPRFKEQIAKGGPVTVTHPEINRFFMTIPEACCLVMEAATMSRENQIFVFDMGIPIKIADLAKRMIRLAGFEPDKDIKIEYTGLRPGEKLYEEVLADKENTLPSFHPRIRIAKVREYQYEQIDPTFHKLFQLARDVNVSAMMALMEETVPEYTPENK
ncbi:MAG: polysaccharide biosynthesis protein [Bacteroidales bacterium]|nr:polysaccharide biosynthesis protein [Bacteroidales bacterium]